MCNLEEKIISAFEDMIWGKYIDDIVFIWKQGEESLEKLLNQLNSFHSTIKFTVEYSKDKNSFLNVNIRCREGADPHHGKNGIPSSQVLRLHRICTDNASFDKHCND